jgi:hypothetical protein
MAAEHQVLKEIQGFIATLTPEKQGIVAKKAAEIRAITVLTPEDQDGLGCLAVALVSAEIAED